MRRRSFAPSFRNMLVLQNIQGGKSISELSLQHDLHPTILYRWKREWLRIANETFQKTSKQFRNSNRKPVYKAGKISVTTMKKEQHRLWMHNLLQGQVTAELVKRQIGAQVGKEDIQILLHEILNKPLRFRNRAISVLALLAGLSKTEIAEFLLIGLSTVDSYISQFKKSGIVSYIRPGAKTYTKLRDPKYINAVFKVLHTPPSDYGVNRTTWRQEDLQQILLKEGLQIGKQYISRIIKDAGFHYRKAKKVLTSGDPCYQEKVTNIACILENLGADEKFFSVDEFGPFAVKMYGGRSLVKEGQVKTIPQFQKSKGSLIIIGALELSANQITYFYSDKKNTNEMITLLDLLASKYSQEKCIYFSWDSASWHASKSLYRRVQEINARKGENVMVKLAPLPSSAQFLNVIESVFSGMARAVLHNSDYGSVQDCKKAIDGYFSARNSNFQKHPKRAGGKIWGMERSKPIFDASNNCKDPRYR